MEVSSPIRISPLIGGSTSKWRAQLQLEIAALIGGPISKWRSHLLEVFFHTIWSNHNAWLHQPPATEWGGDLGRLGHHQAPFFLRFGSLGGLQWLGDQSLIMGFSVWHCVCVPVTLHCPHTWGRMCTCISACNYVYLTRHLLHPPMYSYMETWVPLCASVCVLQSSHFWPTPWLECVYASVHVFMSVWLPMSP